MHYYFIPSYYYNFLSVSSSTLLSGKRFPIIIQSTVVAMQSYLMKALPHLTFERDQLEPVLVRRSYCCNSMYVFAVLDLSQVPSEKEIREFPPLTAYEPHNHYDPYLSLTHNLYVYPLSLNYESQKQFAKVRSQSINGCMGSTCLCCYCLFICLFVFYMVDWL